MNESLYLIEDTLEQIQMQRKIAEAEGDSEALKVIDQIEREYLTKEAAKVTSYVALIRSREATVLACQQERKRIADIQNAAQADIDRLKANALEAMQRFGVKELKATPGGGFRRQANGALQALDTSELTSAVWQNITVTLPALVWMDLMGLAQAAAPNSETYAMLMRLTEKAPRTPDTERIQEALKQRTVPGVKLLPRGEHVRCL